MANSFIRRQTPAALRNGLLRFVKQALSCAKTYCFAGRNLSFCSMELAVLQRAGRQAIAQARLNGGDRQPHLDEKTILMVMKTLILAISMLWLSLAHTAAAAAGGHEVTPEGAWCWFADPRAIHYENSTLGVNMSCIGYIDTHGSIRAMQYDFTRNKQTEVLIRSCFQPDDHNNPTFLALPDGRIMVFYSRHTDEPCFYYRVSRKPGDITTLGQEKTIKTKDNTTYPSPFILSADPEHIYLCWRGINWHPTIARLTMPDSADNVQIADGPYQIVQSTGARPYAKYASNGKNRIYLAYTTGHPDNEYPNWLHFNYIEIPSLKLTDVKGRVLSNVADSVLHVSKTEAYKTQWPLSVVDADPAKRDWLWQIATDKKGRPAIAMVKISEDKQSHLYYYAKWTGSKWRLTYIGDGGKFFHQSPEIENCYSSGMAIDPNNANTVYVSLPTDGAHGRVYELFRLTINDNGEITGKEALTHDSRLSNVRPFVLPGSQGTPLRLAWMYGNYYDWIVSSQRPLGYCTALRCDFEGFSEPVDLNKGLTSSGTALAGDYTVSARVQFDPQKYYGTLFKIGGVEFFIEKGTMRPGLRIDGSLQLSANILGTADTWKLYPRGTNGLWYDPAKLASARITIVREGENVRTYINGLLDQNVNAIVSDGSKVELTNQNMHIADLKVYTRALNNSEIKALR